MNETLVQKQNNNILLNEEVQSLNQIKEKKQEQKIQILYENEKQYKNKVNALSNDNNKMT